MESITPNQARAIGYVEKNFPGVKFVGTTKRSASMFLWRFMDASYLQRKGELNNEAAWKAFYKKG